MIKNKHYWISTSLNKLISSFERGTYLWGTSGALKVTKSKMVMLTKYFKA